MKDIKVFWANHGYCSSEHFEKLEEALAYAKSKCFQAGFWRNGELLGSWCPIGGFRRIGN
jgi:hypothetical protein